MEIGVPKTTHLLATNVSESMVSDFVSASTYVAGEKVYVLVSDFTELLSYGSCVFDTFDKGVGWTYDGTNSAYASDGSQSADSLLTQSNSSLVSGTKYLIIYELQAYTAGNVAAYAGGGEGTDRTAVGWYIEVVTAGATDSKVGVVADLDFVGRVSNLSIKKVADDYVQRDIYESQTGANQGNYPPNDSTNWTKIAASNRWKMFDNYISSKTENLDKISIKLKANKSDTLSFFLTEATGLEYILSDDSFSESSTTSMTPGTGDKTFTMTTNNTIWAVDEKVEIYRTSDQRAFMAGIITAWDSGTGVATVAVTVYDDPAAAAPYTDWTIVRVYDHEIEELITKNATSWLQFYFGDFVYTTNKTYTFSLGFNTSLRAIFTHTTNTMVRIGHLVVDRGVYLGQTLYGIDIGIKSFSTKEQNAFGEYAPVKRRSAQTQKYTISVEEGALDGVRQTLAALDTIPCVFEGNNTDKMFSSLTVFGFWQSFKIGIKEYNLYECDIEIQELT